MSEVLFDEELAEVPVIGIFRGKDPDETARLCRAAWHSGVRLVEVPVQDVDAMPSLARAVSEAAEGGAPVGAGSVTRLEQLDAVIDAGAAFVVCPGVHDGVLDACVARGIPVLPGVATATEIAAVRARGLHWMKAFPASVLGAEWVRAQRAPFPDVSFVATGGIDDRNASEFLDAGCRGVAVGSAFGSNDGILRLRESLGERWA